jgi:hypothetical protein
MEGIRHRGLDHPIAVGTRQPLVVKWKVKMIKWARRPPVNKLGREAVTGAGTGVAKRRIVTDVAAA